MNILINALGVGDSGGITVLDKLLNEVKGTKLIQYLVVCNISVNIKIILDKYQSCNNITFVTSYKKGPLIRLLYEMFYFQSLIKNYNINLIYNSTGTGQPFINTPQLVKIQNLIFFSKKLDSVYLKRKLFVPWLSDILIKRFFVKCLLFRVKHIEVQSSHVENSLSNYISIKNKCIYKKSDINVCDNDFSPPKKYDFSKKIKFLYIVGPHFELPHKNLTTFVNALSAFNGLNVDYEINITLTKDQLHNSEIWDPALDSKTNFLGYISSQDEMNKLFCSNTILVSTSIIETLGLHVIDGIKNGVITIAPNENYARTVYGDNMNLYDTLNSDSLLNAIQVVLKSDSQHSELILSLQDRLKKSEMAKYHNILDIFKEVLNV